MSTTSSAKTELANSPLDSSGLKLKIRFSQSAGFVSNFVAGAAALKGYKDVRAAQRVPVEPLAHTQYGPVSTPAWTGGYGAIYGNDLGRPPTLQPPMYSQVDTADAPSGGTLAGGDTVQRQLYSLLQTPRVPRAPVPRRQNNYSALVYDPRPKGHGVDSYPKQPATVDIWHRQDEPVPSKLCELSSVDKLSYGGQKGQAFPLDLNGHTQKVMRTGIGDTETDMRLFPGQDAEGNSVQPRRSEVTAPEEERLSPFTFNCSLGLSDEEFNFSTCSQSQARTQTATKYKEDTLFSWIVTTSEDSSVSPYSVLPPSEASDVPSATSSLPSRLSVGETPGPARIPGGRSPLTRSLLLNGLHYNSYVSGKGADHAIDLSQNRRQLDADCGRQEINNNRNYPNFRNGLSGLGSSSHQKISSILQTERDRVEPRTVLFDAGENGGHNTPLSFTLSQSGLTQTSVDSDSLPLNLSRHTVEPRTTSTDTSTTTADSSTSKGPDSTRLGLSSVVDKLKKRVGERMTRKLEESQKKTCSNPESSGQVSLWCGCDVAEPRSISEGKVLLLHICRKCNKRIRKHRLYGNKTKNSDASAAPTSVSSPAETLSSRLPSSLEAKRADHSYSLAPCSASEPQTLIFKPTPAPTGQHEACSSKLRSQSTTPVQDSNSSKDAVFVIPCQSDKQHSNRTLTESGITANVADEQNCGVSKDTVVGKVSVTEGTENFKENLVPEMSSAGNTEEWEQPTEPAVSVAGNGDECKDITVSVPSVPGNSEQNNRINIYIPLAFVTGNTNTNQDTPTPVSSVAGDTEKCKRISVLPRAGNADESKTVATPVISFPGKTNTCKTMPMLLVPVGTGVKKQRCVSILPSTSKQCSKSTGLLTGPAFTKSERVSSAPQKNYIAASTSSSSSTVHSVTVDNGTPEVKKPRRKVYRQACRPRAPAKYGLVRPCAVMVEKMTDPEAESMEAEEKPICSAFCREKDLHRLCARGKVRHCGHRSGEMTDGNAGHVESLTSGNSRSGGAEYSKTSVVDAESTMKCISTWGKVKSPRRTSQCSHQNPNESETEMKDLDTKTKLDTIGVSGFLPPVFSLSSLCPSTGQGTTKMTITKNGIQVQVPPQTVQGTRKLTIAENDIQVQNLQQTGKGTTKPNCTTTEDGTQVQNPLQTGETVPAPVRLPVKRPRDPLQTGETDPAPVCPRVKRRKKCTKETNGGWSLTSRFNVKYYAFRCSDRAFLVPLIKKDMRGKRPAHLDKEDLGYVKAVVSQRLHDISSCARHLKYPESLQHKGCRRTATQCVNEEEQRKKKAFVAPTLGREQLDIEEVRSMINDRDFSRLVPQNSRLSKSRYVQEIGEKLYTYLTGGAEEAPEWIKDVAKSIVRKQGVRNRSKKKGQSKKKTELRPSRNVTIEIDYAEEDDFIDVGMDNSLEHGNLLAENDFAVLEDTSTAVYEGVDTTNVFDNQFCPDKTSEFQQTGSYVCEEEFAKTEEKPLVGGLMISATQFTHAAEKEDGGAHISGQQIMVPLPSSCFNEQQGSACVSLSTSAFSAPGANSLDHSVAAGTPVSEGSPEKKPLLGELLVASTLPPSGTEHQDTTVSQPQPPPTARPNQLAGTQNIQGPIGLTAIVKQEPQDDDFSHAWPTQNHQIKSETESQYTEPRTIPFILNSTFGKEAVQLEGMKDSETSYPSLAEKSSNQPIIKTEPIDTEYQDAVHVPVIACVESGEAAAGLGETQGGHTSEEAALDSAWGTHFIHESNLAGLGGAKAELNIEKLIASISCDRFEDSACTDGVEKSDFIQENQEQSEFETVQPILPQISSVTFGEAAMMWETEGPFETEVFGVPQVASAESESQPDAPVVSTIESSGELVCADNSHHETPLQVEVDQHNIVDHNDADSDVDADDGGVYIDYDDECEPLVTPDFEESDSPRPLTLHIEDTALSEDTAGDATQTAHVNVGTKSVSPKQEELLSIVCDVSVSKNCEVVKTAPLDVQPEVRSSDADIVPPIVTVAVPHGQISASTRPKVPTEANVQDEQHTPVTASELLPLEEHTNTKLISSEEHTNTKLISSEEHTNTKLISSEEHTNTKLISTEEHTNIKVISSSEEKVDQTEEKESGQPQDNNYNPATVVQRVVGSKRKRKKRGKKSGSKARKVAGPSKLSSTPLPAAPVTEVTNTRPATTVSHSPKTPPEQTEEDVDVTPRRTRSRSSVLKLKLKVDPNNPTIVKKVITPIPCNYNAGNKEARTPTKVAKAESESNGKGAALEKAASAAKVQVSFVAHSSSQLPVGVEPSTQGQKIVTKTSKPKPKRPKRRQRLTLRKKRQAPVKGQRPVSQQVDSENSSNCEWDGEGAPGRTSSGVGQRVQQTAPGLQDSTETTARENGDGRSLFSLLDKALERRSYDHLGKGSRPTKRKLDDADPKGGAEKASLARTDRSVFSAFSTMLDELALTPVAATPKAAPKSSRTLDAPGKLSKIKLNPLKIKPRREEGLFARMMTTTDSTKADGGSENVNSGSKEVVPVDSNSSSERSFFDCLPQGLMDAWKK